jgi:hypothetical protein
MNDHETRVRERAHRIWEEEGRPEGRSETHWDMASELVAIEENQLLTTAPVHRDSDNPEVAADEVEPVGPAAAAAAGDLPTLTDEGEQKHPPSRPNESDDQPPAGPN